MRSARCAAGYRWSSRTRCHRCHRGSRWKPSSARGSKYTSRCWTHRKRRERVIQALLDVGLTENDAAEPLLHRYPHEFSGGQRQRIAIARALIVRPQVLVLDEPTSALDVTIQKQVLELLGQLQRKYGLSYILVTHDVDVVRAMAHRVIVMKDSLVVESGSLEEVLNRPKSDYTRRLVEAGVA